MAEDSLSHMLARLPQLYRDGELLRGLLAQPAIQLEILLDDMREVQRAHWVDATLDRDEAVGLGAVLDIGAEPWQSLGEYRAWLHATRDAMLQRGAVTRTALQQLVVDYTRRSQAATGIQVWDTARPWASEPGASGPAFVENPLRRRTQRVPLTGGLEPLQGFRVVQRGLDDTPAALLLVGLPAAPECAPLVANLTTGQALLYLGSLAPGARLWIRPEGDGLVAELEGEDVSDRLRSISDLEPGSAWSHVQVHDPAQPLIFRRGTNELWFLPVAHFDVPGLDRFLLALAAAEMSQGRYDEGRFDRALYYQEPAALLRLSWLESEPASFAVRLPPGHLLSPAGQLDESLAERDRLEFSLDRAVQSLKAAGVRAVVDVPPFQEIQGQRDRLSAVLPQTHREIGPSGADHLPDVGAVFEVTAFNGSAFR